jgi:site-specific DNA-cytosine methylase
LDWRVDISRKPCGFWGQSGQRVGYRVQTVRVLIACEYSATVRDAFRARGHDAWSCDLLPTEGDPRWHIQGDVLAMLHGTSPFSQHRSPCLNCGSHKCCSCYAETYCNVCTPWDLLIAHPPCTDLAVSGARHFPEKIADGRQGRALAFVQALLDAPIPRIALENPVSVISSKIRKPDQIIQPWQFGHGETKATCLWLKGLPKLRPTNIVEGRADRIHKMPPGPNRWKERSRTFPGIAEAMADQWGDPATLRLVA